MIAVPEKYALEVNSPTSIKSERQHEQYLSVLDELASKDNQTSEEEKSGPWPADSAPSGSAGYGFMRLGQPVQPRLAVDHFLA